MIRLYKNGSYEATVASIEEAKSFIWKRGSYHLFQREYEVVLINPHTLRVGVITNDSYGWCKDTVQDWEIVCK